MAKSSSTHFMYISNNSTIYAARPRSYDVFFGPLSRFPGPRSWAASYIPRVATVFAGQDAQVWTKLHERYGAIVRIGPRELSVIPVPGNNAWKDIYGFKNPLPRDPDFSVKSMNGTHSVLSADGAHHARQRKALAHAFSDRALKQQEPLLQRWAMLLKQKLAERADGTTAVDMATMYNCATFDIMGDLTFSESLHMLENSKYTPWWSKWGVNYLVSKSKALRRERLEHWRYTADRIERRVQREPEHADLWSYITKYEGEEDGLRPGEHHSNAALFMIAGTETTATALAGTTYHLVQNPRMMQKMVAELRGAFPHPGTVDLESLAHLPYLNSVLHEGLRMYPPVPSSRPRRTGPEGATICGEYIPGDIRISIPHLATYRSSANFKDPDSFEPERWLKNEAYRDDNLSAVQPFSFGPTNCLGKNLAWHEMRLLLAVVLLHFDLRLCPEAKDWTNQKVFTFWEKPPLLCTLEPTALDL
ncbi:hypothetical protein M409DRAFT_63948 [Zasmidium cellare ATCC 36951]|uniref:Cytochrome P450 n=1 Tax=Zasmidium cellare ATCC 36951 TaxID=1080233 RepID=A0A6A6CUT0_ZASCE|nr:uncharacterized protein M409DRAFT_63948 [Zasmidium cellare ATCC 36951]KAF2170927.1 hypothetical protein M409DRAFT_63948 [Zasmidium cellare ATCC 36951]